MDIVNTLSSREIRGTAHFMKQLDRTYEFPISVFLEDENGTRTLLRVEDPSL